MSTIDTLAGLFKRDINPVNVMWFYFDHDWSRDADECYVFFAVYNDKIVLESCHFMSSEPLILTQDKEDDPIWNSHPYFHEAVILYWYRKYYSETKEPAIVLGIVPGIRSRTGAPPHESGDRGRDARENLWCVRDLKLAELQSRGVDNDHLVRLETAHNASRIKSIERSERALL